MTFSRSMEKNERILFDEDKRTKFIDLLESINDGSFLDMLMEKDTSLNYVKASLWDQFTNEYNKVCTGTGHQC
jgi:hypothetical protein